MTLTYDDEHVPRVWPFPSEGFELTLNFRDVTLFLKKLRRWLAKDRGTGFRCSYFLCGEYGGQLQRPHYHLLLFGVWFRDARYFKKSAAGFELYRSAVLDKLWSRGHADIGSLTFESAAYAARYVVEKINGDMAPMHYMGRVAEDVRMSLKPAIGKRWFERFQDDVFPSDEVVVSGRKVRTPLYYDRLQSDYDAGPGWLLDKRAPADRPSLEAAKASRVVRGLKSLGNRSPTRLTIREEVARARLDLYKKKG